MVRKKRKAPKKVQVAKPQTGVAAGGSSIDPWGLPEEPARHSGAQLKVAPPPGVPVSEAEYKRLKEEARNRPSRLGTHAQEDDSNTNKA
jgi:hypothetical protein